MGPSAFSGSTSSPFCFISPSMTVRHAVVYNGFIPSRHPLLENGCGCSIVEQSRVSGDPSSMSVKKI